MRNTEMIDIPINRSMVRPPTWHGESSSRHRIAVVLFMVVAAVVLFALATRVHADELSDLKVSVKMVEEPIRWG